MNKIILAGALLILAGAGCNVPFIASDLASEDLDLAGGSTITLKQTYLGFNIPGSDTPEKVVTLNEWSPGMSAALTWTQTEQRETEASVAARAAATNSPVGSGVKVPDPVYEDLVTKGTIKTDALASASRVSLPAAWSASDVDLTGKENSIIWLSTAQYIELTSTRSTHVAIGAVDNTLGNLQNITQEIRDAIASFQGQQPAETADSTDDLTTITANADWGSRTLIYNGQKVKVKTVEAENKFAHYSILANPDNPIILKVDLHPWALSSSLLQTMNVLEALAGYDVKEISTK